jgi:hypothetical protein
MLDPEDEGIVILRNSGIHFIEDANLESFGVCFEVGAVEADEYTRINLKRKLLVVCCDEAFVCHFDVFV